MINVRRKNNFHIDSAEDLYGKDCVFLCVCVCDILCMQEMEVTDYVQQEVHFILFGIEIMQFPSPTSSLCLVSVTLFNCSVGRSDCSRCRTADPKYGCVWCGGAASSRCVYQDSCTDEVQHTCPAPVIHFVRMFLPSFERFLRIILLLEKNGVEE